MSKYPNALAERLYGEDPDEQYGNSSEGIGWAGIYIANDDAEVAEWEARIIVLVESTDGFVDLYRAQTMTQARGIAEQYADDGPCSGCTNGTDGDDGSCSACHVWTDGKR